MAAGTVVYVYPVTPGPPTALQAKELVIADITFAAGDTAAVITHNMGFSPADGSDGRPEVSFVPTAGGATASLPTVAYTNLNSITVDRTANGGTTGVTVRVYIRRPHTIGR